MPPCEKSITTSIRLAFPEGITHNDTEAMQALALLDILYDVMVSPTTALSRVAERKPWPLAIATAVFIALIFAFVLLPYPPQLADIILGLERGTLPLVPVVFVWVLMFLIILSAQAALFHLLATLFRGKGTYRGMLCGLCFVWLPAFFVAPLALLRVLLDSSSGHILYIVGSFILTLWVLLLYIIAIRQNYRLSPLKAIITGFIPLFIMFVLPPLIVAIIEA
jgi:hypothetical protein